MAALKEDPLQYILDATEGKEVEDLALLPQLIPFIAEESKKPRFQNKAKDFFFIEGGRKGHIKCKYVDAGTTIFGLNTKREPILNITHVAIRNDEGGEKNVLDRICRDVLAMDTPLKGVRIESIMSEEWKRKFKDDWIDNGEDNKVLLKKDGGKSTRKSKRRKSRKRK